MTATMTAEDQAVLESLTEVGSYELDVIPMSETYVDTAYQRDLTPIRGPFKPWLVGSLVVSERELRGKSLSVIDGQRRRDKMEDAGVEKAPACIFCGLSREREAIIFVELQKARKAITPVEEFKAGLAGKIPTTVAINKVVVEEGFQVAPNEQSMRQIKAVRTLERIYEDDPDKLRTVLWLIRETWDGIPFASRDQMLKGVWLFLGKVEDLDQDRFINRLSSLTPSEINVRATRAREAKGLHGTAPKYVGEVIHDAYRGRRRS